MAVITKKDGRIIRTGSDYTRFRRETHASQSGMCKDCGRLTSLTVPLYYSNSFHVHHKNGRGMGGAKRNDIPSEVRGLCQKCHSAEHGQGEVR
jgi:5-methylcytosine-specific restriction endonuclease McrA